MAVERILRLIVALLVGVYVARYLGPDRFGVLSFAISLVGLFTAIQTLGLDGILIRELVSHKNKQEILLGTAFILRVASSLVALALVLGTVWLPVFEIENKWLLTVVALGIPFSALGVIESYFNAKVMARYVVAAQLVQLFVSAVFRVSLVLVGASLIWFAWSVFIEGAVLGLGLLCMYFVSRSGLGSWRFVAAEATGLLRASWPLIISGLFIAVYMKIDQVMLMQLAGEHSVGVYAAAVRLSELWYFVPVIIATSVFPSIVNAKKSNSEYYYRRLQSLYDLMILLSVGVALLMTFSADAVVSFLYGEAFHETADILMVHIWAGVLVFAGVVRGRWILVEHLQHKQLWIDLSGAVLNVLLNLLLIPVYGAMGAAVATILSYFLASVIASLFVRELRTFLRMFGISILHLFQLRLLRTRTSDW